jgi:hypothetical protein
MEQVKDNIGKITHRFDEENRLFKVIGEYYGF